MGAALSSTVLLLCALVVAGPAPVRANDLVDVAPALSVGFTPNYRAIVKHAGPAVVGIVVEGVRTPSALEFASDAGASAMLFKTPLPFHGQGSGFIISADGLVLTSAHVIQGARRITVRMSDRREFRAQVVGRDQVTDVAVLRIGARDLPILRMGQTAQLQVGDPVVAIGAPFGLEQSVSHGIVSATRRALPGFSAVPQIQTDAPVNPGHSGGPLLDASAAVVGMHAQIYSLSGAYEGLSFAVPIDVVLRVKNIILAHGRVPHSYLGVTMQSLDLTLANAFGQDRPLGALVAGVDLGSAAEAAGLQVGDIIIGVNGQSLDHASELTGHLAMAFPGDRMRLTVWRTRTSQEVVVRLGETLDLDDLGNADTSALLKEPQELGWRLRTLSAQERRLLGVASGVWVDEVSALSAQAGLRAGDVLLAINLKPMLSTDEVQAAVRNRPLQLALLIDRDGTRMFIPLSIE